VEKGKLNEYTKQCTESYMNIYMYIFLLQIIIYIQVVTETEEVRVGYGRHCICTGLHFLKDK